MRTIIKTEEIKPGIKAFKWEAFCLKKDTIRRKYIPDYDPLKLGKEAQMLDWVEFEEQYHQEYEEPKFHVTAS